MKLEFEQQATQQQQEQVNAHTADEAAERAIARHHGGGSGTGGSLAFFACLFLLASQFAPDIATRITNRNQPPAVSQPGGAYGSGRPRPGKWDGAGSPAYSSDDPETESIVKQIIAKLDEAHTRGGIAKDACSVVCRGVERLRAKYPGVELDGCSTVADCKRQLKGVRVYPLTSSEKVGIVRKICKLLSEE